MPKRYWSIVIAVVIVGGPVHGQEASQLADSQTIAASLPGNPRAPFPIVIDQTAEDASHQAAREQQSDQHDAADLLAQQQAASAAVVSATATQDQLQPIWIGAILSAAAAALSAVALGFSIWTFFRSDRTTRSELRAYIGVEKCEVEVDPNGKWVTVKLKFKNAGATPARQVRVAHHTILEAQPFRPEWVNNAFPGSSAMVLPGGEIYITDRMIDGVAADDGMPMRTADLNAAIEGKTHGLWATGRIVYEDVFGKERWTNYRYIMKKRKGLTIGMTACPEGNEAD